MSEDSHEDWESMDGIGRTTGGVELNPGNWRAQPVQTSAGSLSMRPELAPRTGTPAAEKRNGRTQKSVSTTAEDRKIGMTLGELVAFVQEAMGADIPREEHLRAAIGWSGQVQWIGTGTKRP